MSLLNAAPQVAWHSFSAAVIAVRGPDSVDLLHRLCTQNLRPLSQAGGSADALFVTHQGKLVQRLRVWSDVTGLYLGLPAGTGADFVDYLRKYTIIEDVDYVLRGEQVPCAMLLWQSQAGHPSEAGPLVAASPVAQGQARALLADASADLLPHTPAEVPSAQQIRAAHDFLLPAPLGFGPGLVVIGLARANAAALAAEVLPQLWSEVSGLSLAAASAALGGPMDNLAFRALRLRAGVPAWQEDYDAGAMPFEHRLTEGALAWNKGCYVGQEVLSRLDSYKKVARVTMGLLAPAAAAVAWAQSAKNLEVVHAGQRIGRITSWAPEDAVPSGLAKEGAPHEAEAFGTVALAVIKQAFAGDGTEVEVHGTDADGCALTVFAAVLRDRPLWAQSA